MDPNAFLPSEPPPGWGSMGLLSMATVVVMMAVTFVMHSATVWLNSRMVREYRGIRTAVFAAITLAVQFVVLSAMPPGPLPGTLANVLTILGHLLFYLAICRFAEWSVYRPIVFGLVPLGILGIAALFALPSTRPVNAVVIAKLVSVVLSLAPAFVLLRARTERFRLGSFVTAIPLLVYGLFSLMRFVQGVIAPESVRPGPSANNLLDALSLFVLSFMWIAGFNLMISQRLQSDLRELALNDALTQVRNRRAMQSLLDFEMKRVQRDVKGFSVALVDVDHFKNVNDTWGHDVGDHVLQGVAQALQGSLRLPDAVARWGGEEFLVLLPDTEEDESRAIAERLRAAVAALSFSHGTHALGITISVGVASSRAHHEVSTLLKVADQALYRAKRTRNTVCTGVDLVEPST